MRKWVHILAAARQFPAQKFEGKHGKQPVSRKIYEKKVEKFIEICNRKRKKVKGKLKTFQTQSLLSYRYSVDLPFCF